MRVAMSARLLCLATLLLACVRGAAQMAPVGADKQSPLTAAQQQRLTERERLLAEVKRLWGASQYDEAVAAWEKGVGADRAVFGKNHEQVAWSLQSLALLHEQRWNFVAARTARQEVLAIRLKQYGA